MEQPKARSPPWFGAEFVDQGIAVLNGPRLGCRIGKHALHVGQMALARVHRGTHAGLQIEGQGKALFKIQRQIAGIKVHAFFLHPLIFVIRNDTM